MDLVSIIIPSYKRPEFLDRAITSALTQSYENIEVVVVDDNNPGDPFRKETEKIMDKYRGASNVIYVQNDKNSERSFTRNNGVIHAHGQYIMFLDNDDEFLPDKVRSQLTCFQTKSEEYTVCYCAYIRKKDGRIIARCGEHREGARLLDAIARDLYVHAGSNLMIKRDAFEKVGGFNTELSINEDIDLLVRLLCKGKIAYCDTIGLIVNTHAGSSSDYAERTNLYEKAERHIIEELPEDQRKYVAYMLAVQVARVYMFKDFRMAFRVIRQKHVPLLFILRYCCYLARRMITRKAFGFDGYLRKK